MSLSLRPRPQRTAPDDVDDVAADVPPIAAGSHQTSSALLTKLASGGIVVCLILGPVGAAVGALAWARSSGPVAAGPSVVADQSGERAIAGEYAQRVVMTWLTATQDSADDLLGMVRDAQLAALPTEPFRPAHPTVAGIENVDGIWSVTVAVTVTDARDQTARRFYQVPVMLTGDTVIALTLPTPVSPRATEPGATNEYRTHIDPTSPVGQTVAEFLGAYIAGAGDVSRYVTPGRALTAIEPAPYTGVALVELRSLEALDPAAVPADGQQMRVLTVAVATVTDSQSSLVSYALTLTARAGRWEITAIDPAPAAQTPDAVPAPETAPTGTSPTTAP